MRGAGVALVALIMVGVVPQAANAGAFEDKVFAKINQVRRDPRGYAEELRRYARLGGRFQYARAAWDDEADATEDAIDFLFRQRPLPALARNRNIDLAAAEHVRRQGPRGDVGHGPPGSLSIRLHGHGVWASLAAESISYGQATPSDVVRQLVVDSGVPDRGHRLDIFGRVYQAAGVACGRHAEWGSMCVIDFAGGLVRR